MVSISQKNYHQIIPKTWQHNCDVTCSFCGTQEEDADHLMFTCPSSLEVWGLHGQVFNIAMPFSKVQQMCTYLTLQKAATTDKARTSLLSLLPHGICWSMWRERNEHIFRGSRIYIENNSLRAVFHLSVV